MSQARRRSSTTRFAVKLLLVVVLVCVAVYFILLSELQRTLDQRLARLYAAGVPKTWADVASPQVPDNDNAAIWYQRAFDELSLAPRDLDILGSFLDDEPPGSRLTLLEQTRRILANNQAALSLVRQGTAARQCRFPVHWEQSPVVIVFPHFRPLRTCAELLAAEAIVTANEGDSDGALEWCLAQFRLNWHSVLDPVFFSFKEAGVGLRPVPFRRALEHANIDAKTCARLYAELQRLDFQTPFVQSTRTEASMILGHFDAAERHERALRDMLEPLAGELPLGRVFLAVYLNPLGRLLRLKEEIECADMAARMVELAQQSYRVAAPAYAALDDMTGSLPRYRLITRASFGYHGELAIRRDRVITIRNAMQVALALKAYHATRGAYPDSLNALRRYPGWTLPTDPFSGKGFVYKRTGAGFVLYSWGPDLDDDGGREVA